MDRPPMPLSPPHGLGAAFIPLGSESSAEEAKKWSHGEAPWHRDKQQRKGGGARGPSSPVAAGFRAGGPAAEVFSNQYGRSGRFLRRRRRADPEGPTLPLRGGRERVPTGPPRRLVGPASRSYGAQTPTARSPRIRGTRGDVTVAAEEGPKKEEGPCRPLFLVAAGLSKSGGPWVQIDPPRVFHC